MVQTTPGIFTGSVTLVQQRFIKVDHWEGFQAELLYGLEWGWKNTRRIKQWNRSGIFFQVLILWKPSKSLPGRSLRKDRSMKRNERNWNWDMSFPIALYSDASPSFIRTNWSDKVGEEAPQHHQQPLQGMTNRKQHNSSYREGIMAKMVELRKIVGSLSSDEMVRPKVWIVSFHQWRWFSRLTCTLDPF